MKNRPLRVAVLADSLPPRGHTGVGMAQSHICRALGLAGVDARAFAFLEQPKALVYPVKALLRSFLGLCARLRRPWSRPGRRLELDTALLGALGGRALLPALRSFDPDWILAPDYGAAASLWPVEWRRKVVVVAHSGPLRFLNQPLIGARDPWDARLAWALEARMSREAAAGVAPSRAMRRAYERDYPRRGPVFVVPNLPDEDLLRRVRAGRTRPRRGEHRVFLPSAGNPNKGRAVLADLLRGMALELAPERVVFVVSGALDAALRRRLYAALPKNAVLEAPGLLSYERNLALMASCVLCVSPTFVESFGMALLEAQCCGLPVACFDVEATPEVVAHGRTGLLVPLADAAALARVSAALLQDRPRLARYGRAALARSSRVSSVRRGGAAYIRILRSLDPK